MKNFFRTAMLISLWLSSSGEVCAQSFLEKLESRIQGTKAAESKSDTLPEPADGSPTLSDANAEPDEVRPQPGRPGHLGLVGDDVEGGLGVLAVTVRKDSAAAKGGFREGDRIIAVDGERVRNMDDMARRLQRRWVGSPVAFVVVRDGREMKLNVVLGERPEEPAAPADDSVLVLPAESPVLGARLEAVNEPLKTRFGFRAEAGAVITGIEVGTPAERYRLPIGGVIVDVNGHKIAGPEDIDELRGAAKVGDEWELAYYVRNQRYRTKLRLAPPAPPPTPLPEATDEPSAEGAPGRLDLGNRLGRNGQRPLLGRLGRALDDVIDEVPALDTPLDTPAAPAPLDEALPEESLENADASEVSLLREEVGLLRKEIEILRRRVEQLERHAPAARLP